ncbi:e3 binding domain-containing protein [Roseivivax lentus]|uniref:E3 binding domain-containing protein n=1 Tax=Roseivivax lentus TaxID=633194 RepID=A0A1N7L4B6_9RHOB|nr:E3 binding domain-containing protein [Roseivivax lentus]SIS68702.1 e3 binding domain-containing protein [Roseivivax lentus]
MRARRPASPYARHLARTRGVVLEEVTGSGPGGRVVARDIPEGGADAQPSEAAQPKLAAAAAPRFVILRRVLDQAPDSGTEIAPLVAAIAPGHTISVTDLRGAGLDGVDPVPAEGVDAALGLAGREGRVSLTLSVDTRRLALEDGSHLLTRLVAALKD